MGYCFLLFFQQAPSYFVNIGPKEARTCGFMNESGEPYKLKKIIDEENQQIILKAIK